MKILKYMKDGGKDSRVWGFWLVEMKNLLSVVLLHFHDGSREAYHSHAFNSISWVLSGKLVEERLEFTGSARMTGTRVYKPSFRPIITTRDNLHKVTSEGDTFVLSFRGPWTNVWKEFLPERDSFVTLTHGRKVVE